MSESKAKKKVNEVKRYNGLKEFEVLMDSKYLKKGAKVDLTYELYEVLKGKKLVK